MVEAENDRLRAKAALVDLFNQILETHDGRMVVAQASSSGTTINPYGS